MDYLSRRVELRLDPGLMLDGGAPWEGATLIERPDGKVAVALSAHVRRKIVNAFAWIEEPDPRPWFLFLHTYAAHFPYGGFERYRREHPERGLLLVSAESLADTAIDPWLGRRVGQWTIVERIAAAGAVVLGKANMDEFAMGSSTEHSARGVTRNPWSHDRIPGGSSGGSAAAVASGMVAVAHGNDMGTQGHFTRADGQQGLIVDVYFSHTL